MLNSFLSQLLFGNSSSNDQQQLQQQQQQQHQDLQQQHESSICSIRENLTSQSAIKTNDNEKFIDVRNDVDWVIIDPSDNDEVKKHLKRKLNSMAKSMQMSEYGLTNLFDIASNTYASTTNCGASDGATMSDESMDRSLSFDESVQSRPMTPQLRETREQQIQQQQPVAMTYQPQQQMVEQDAWLITPLPSLVSLQTSQKSINEIAPLENLLIEHPSMSVFITQDEINESEEAIADSSSFALIDKDENKPGIEQQKSKKNKKKAKKPQAVEPQQKQQQQAVPNNKENQQQAVQQQQQQPRTSQLCNKATSNKCLISSQFYKERCNQLKLQEKCKYYVKNVNLKQRKYHNLQQPQYLNVNFVNIRH